MTLANVTSSEPSQAVAVPTPRQQRTQINVVLFSGGSGTHSITEALLKHPQIAIRILINAYDDGLSTGRLRKFIPSMLGPSDVRKNINRLAPVKERSQQSLKAISDHRLPVGISREDALSLLRNIITRLYAKLPDKIGSHFPNLCIRQADTLCSYLETFLNYFEQQEKIGRTFDFTDCAVGNLLFAGCYLQESQDFNRSIKAFSRFYEVDPNVLLNVTLGENLFLVAEKEDGSVLLNEADIVAQQSSAKISKLFLLDESTYRNHVEHSAAPTDGWSRLFRESNHIPKVNPEVSIAIAEADVIIYGPGTQHSSLFPSYMTRGLAEAIMANSNADKVFVANIHRDYDMQLDDANDLARKFVEAMNRDGEITVDWRAVVSHFFLQNTAGTPDVSEEAAKAKYIPFDPAKFAYPLETVRLKDWELSEGRHYGGYVLDELQQIVQGRIDIDLERMQHMLSIVIPVLNEGRTVEEVLKSVVALDFLSLGLSKEVILVDGGSTDRTVELARSVRSVKVYQLTDGAGRGAALKLGISKARGNIIAFFPGDKEYSPEDLHTIVGSLVKSKFRAVFGSRAVKCVNLTEDLRKVYSNQTGLYLASKYGGILLSVATLLLYNRYISDVLSSVKAFDAQLLRSLNLKSDGRELDTEIVAKISRKQEYLLEMPVTYQPRTRSAGKKITMMDGVRSVLALFRFRISN